MLRRSFISILVFFAFTMILTAEPTVKLTPPTLKPGMAGIEAMLESSADDFNDDIAELVSSSLAKPLFMEGFAGAASLVVLIPGSVHERETPVITLGSAASVYSQRLSLKTVDQISAMTPEDDMKAGACVQPLVIQIVMPLDFLLPRLTVAASGGYMDAEAGDYGIMAWSAGLNAGYRFFTPKKGFVTWDGISLKLGSDYAINRLTALINPGVISQTIPIDPDDSGPLVPFEISMNLDPEIRAGVESGILSFKLQASSGVTFLKAFSIFGGFGCSASFAKAGISISTNEPIIIEGYLADLVETPGRISIQGTTAEQEVFSVGGYILGGLKFSVGAFDMSLPLVWKPFDSLGFGFFVGVHL